MCYLTKSINTKTYTITYCNTPFCFMFGRQIKLSKIYIKKDLEVNHG